jgi:hypothetical protein
VNRVLIYVVATHDIDGKTKGLPLDDESEYASAHGQEE